MLSENIKTLRKARGLSQQELAERLHVVRQTVSKWEQGLSVPDAAMLVQLAECLEVSVEELLGTPKSDSTAPKPPEELLADKLGQLTAQLAQQNTRRRRFWKGVAIAAGAGAACLLPPAAIAVWIRLPGGFPAGSTGVIGGADGPTEILITGEPALPWRLLLALGGCIVLTVLGLVLSHRQD